jgi:riboflavin kinase/FMN adenylyltransferase
MVAFNSIAFSAKLMLMEVINWIDFAGWANGASGGGQCAVPCVAKCAVHSAITIGVFDGVHRGHCELIEKINSKKINGYAKNIQSMVVTFKEHPRRTLHPEKPHTEIISAEEKIAIFELLGIDVLLLIDFTPEFSKMRGEEFIKTLVCGAKAAYIAIGEDFKCGHDGGTNAPKIKSICCALGVECEIVAPVLEGGKPVSSSRIRGALAEGDIKTAELLLGRNFNKRGCYEN